MNKGLRLTEQWMRRALWLVAVVFAAFLIGLGGQIVDNMMYVAPRPDAEQLVDPAKARPIQDEIVRARSAHREANRVLAQAEQKHEVAKASTRSARAAFDNWLATRHTTARPDQDSELIGRTRQLDGLVAAEREALAAVEAQQQAALDADQAEDRAVAAYEALLEPAQHEAARAAERAERKVFLWRLGLTLPLLLVAGWLFKHKRNGTYWPFAWGFIFFALFAFFVELVPYLPSYGGYVRYGVGIVVTVVVGRYAIRWLHAWLERQKASEALPEEERRTAMRYDVALERIGKGLCPSCERTTNFRDKTLNSCPHCGIGLFDRCGACRTRKNAFMRYCFSCGAAANASLAD
ncbi:serine endopeptidase [uncultured Massilia sp.]|uniref:serine endopeptidase n=1 Tax=uncultured Massilia sp. TaxID=169973 RepID=UPI0025F19D8F|nr:serine endopeptidase [uncultured Massilia sp.]